MEAQEGIQTFQKAPDSHMVVDLVDQTEVGVDVPLKPPEEIRSPVSP